MRIVRTSLSNGVLFIGQAVVGFVLDRFASVDFVHAGFEAAALDHEAGDDAVENQAVVVAVFDILFEVRSSNRCILVIEFNIDSAEVCS